MLKTSCFLLLVVTLLTSCSKDREVLVNGARIVYKEEKGGDPARYGDTIKFHLVVVNRTQDRIINNTYEQGAPKAMLVKKPLFEGGLEEAFPYLAAGDSAIVYVEAKNLFLKNMPWKIPEYDKDDQLEYYLRVLDVIRRNKTK